MHKPQIAVIVLGGTITMIPTDRSGIAPKLTGDDLVAACPGLLDVAEVRVSTPFLLPGPSLTQAHVAEVAQSAARAMQDGAAGVVVVQGTDTIDEVSFLLDLFYQGEAPVVVTGAMRGASAAGADGPANLLAAVTTAASAAARGLGVLVVLNDVAHAARHVAKSDTASPAAFASPGFGPVGRITEGRFVALMRPVRTLTPAIDPAAAAAPVAIVKTGLGDDGRLLQAIAELGFQGCVIEGMGAGHVPMSVVPGCEALARQMPVILATRVTAGPVFTKTYGYAGSELDLIGRGLIPAGNLPAHKARLLLAALIGQGAGMDTIRAAFAAFS